MTSSQRTSLRAATSRDGRRASRPSSVGYLAGLVVAALLIGVLLGRAIGLGGGDGPPPDGPEGAIDAFRSYLGTRPDDATAWQGLGDAHLQIAVENDDTTHYVAADEAYLRADELAPGHPEVARGRARVALGLHHFNAAAELAGQAHETRPRDPMALAALIDAEVEIGHYESAEGHLEELLSFRPDLAALS